MAQAPGTPGTPSAGTLLRPALPTWARVFWSDPLLLGAFLIAGLLVSSQLVLTLLQPSWWSNATDWLHTALAWLVVLGLGLVSWWFTRTQQPGAFAWWLLCGAVLAYALGQSLFSVYNQRFFPQIAPVPWWSDLFALLQYPGYFLVLALWPGVSTQSQSARGQLKVVLDSLLFMGAVSALAWYFLLAPLYLHSGQSLLGKATALAYAVGDVGVLCGLVLTRLRPSHAQRPALSILMLAALVLIVGDVWFAALNLSAPYVPGGFPDLFWTLALLLALLAGVVQLRVTQRTRATLHERLPEEPLSQGPGQPDLKEAFHLLAPFAAALLASVIIAVRTIIGPLQPLSPLAPSLVILGLLFLVFVRQGVTLLENAQLQRERQAARGRELAAQAREDGMREANRQMEAFLGIASHELKTPLSSILLGLQMIQRRIQRQESKPTGAAGERESALVTSQGALEVTIQQLGRLNRLVNDLVDISRIQSGRLEFTFKPADLAAIVELAVEAQRQATPERTILLRRPPTGSRLISVDAERIGQVVTNYLTNALKYADEATPVEVGVQVEGEQARVWVRDQGPGIPSEEQAHVWERFHRVAGIEVQSGSGIGLGMGLHICRTIIERHQGQVGVESVPGQGSTFWFTLPLESLDPDGASQAQGASRGLSI